MKNANVKDIVNVVIIMLAMIAIAAVAIISAGSFAAGNKGLLDTKFNFDYAMIELPGGQVVEGEVEKWYDYDGEQLQVIIDGKTYLTHSENVTLICTGEK